MADNFESNLDDQRERLKIQKQINEAVKDNVKSFGDLGNYSKTIVDNFKDLQETNVRIKENQKLILRLKESTNEEDKKQAALLEQENRELEKKTKQIREINKELAKKAPLAAGKALLGFLGEAVNKYLDFDQKARDVAAQIGLGGQRMQIMRDTVISASIEMQKYGVTTNDALEAQQAYSDELGRAVILSEQALTNMARIGKATGLGMTGMAGLTAEMEAFGLGAEQATDFIFEMSAESSQMGLNSAKVIKSFQSNLGLLNKLNFKAGVSGLKEMAKFSEKFKLSMQSVAAVADKVFRPEGAIEAAAQLQVLGGSLAALGDPFQLMYKARNAPEELTKQLANAAAATATFNAKTGEFEVSAYELDRLKEAANALGLSYDELAASAKQTAKISRFEDLLGGKGLTPEQTEALAMMAQVSKSGEAQIQIFDAKAGKAIMKDIKSLSGQELQQALDKKREAEEAAQQATGVKEQWENLFNQFLLSTYPLLETLMKELKPVFDKFSTKGTEIAIGLSNFIKGISPFVTWLTKFVVESPKLALGLLVLFKSGIFSLASWYLKGLRLGAGFNMAVGQGGVFNKIKGFFGLGGKGGTPPITPPVQTPPVQTPPPTLPTNTVSAAGGFMSSLGSAVGSAVKILAIAGAMYILAEALIKFNDVEWESLAKAGVAMIGFGIGLQFLEPILAEFAALSVSGLGWAGVGLILAFGAAMLAIGGAVYLAASGLAILVDSFTNMFAVIGPNGDGILKAGVGFLALAAGIGVLTLSLIAMGAASILALPGLLILGATTAMLVSTAETLNAVGGSNGLKESINAINSVDTEKLEALKSLSNWLALLGGTTTVKFDETLEVDGEIVISGSGGGKTNTDWIKDPIFISKLKNAIFDKNASDKNYGKANRA